MPLHRSLTRIAQEAVAAHAAEEEAARAAADAALDSRVDTLEAAPASGGSTTEWYPEMLVDGILVVQANILPPGLRVPKATSLREVHLLVNVAPVGGPVTVTVLSDATILATATIPAGGTTAALVLTTPLALTVGSRIRLDVTSTGTTEPGQDLAVSLVCS